MRTWFSMLILTIVLFFIFPAVLQGQELQSEHIRSFNSDITIEKSGRIQVKETIVYNFVDLQRRGIFRNINYIKKNQDGKKYKLDIDVNGVTDLEGKRYTYQVTTENEQVKIRIGDADRTVTGVQTYVIDYTVSGALTYFSDHDELYWNVTGNGWEIPILESRAEITLPFIPEESPVHRAACYTGVLGSQTANCTALLQGDTAIIQTTRMLSPYEGLTFVEGFPQGQVTRLEPVEVIPFSETWYGKLIIAAVIFALITWYILYPLYIPLKWFFSGRDPRGLIGEASAWYDPPKTRSGRLLTPAETGTLIDEHAGPKEISALIVDLARRGYFKIVEKKKDDYELVKGKEFKGDPDLLKHEMLLLIELFASKDKVRVKDADMYDVVKTVQDELYETMVKEGFFPENPDKIRKYYSVISGMAAVTFNFFLLMMAAIFGRLMPKKTLEGVHASNVAKSLKNFLKSQDRQLEFQAQNQMFFEKLLPFAVAFGVEKIWAERFKDIDMKEPDWYKGSVHGAFNSSSFTRSLGSSLSSVNSAATPTTSSSGFSSGFSSGGGGGGSSGGGGGGGGGGSW